MADPRVGAAIRPGFTGQGGDTPGRVGLPPGATGQRPRDEPDRAPPPETRDSRTARASPRACSQRAGNGGASASPNPSQAATWPTSRPAPRREDGSFVLTGQKDYGEWAQLSGWCHLLARTERESTGRDGLTWFLLDMSTPGLFLNPVEYTTGRVFAEIFLDDVVVPESAILGEHGAGVGHRRRVPDGSPTRLRAYRLGQKDA